MNRIMVLFLVFFLSSAAVYGGQKELRMTTGNMLYLQMDFFNMKVVSEYNKDGYAVGSEEFKKLIKRYPNAYKEYEAYESELMMSTIVMLGSQIAAAGLVYLSFGTNDAGYHETNVPMLIAAAGISGAGGFVGYMMRNSAVNHFYASLHEYNKTILYIGFRKSGCLGAGVQQNF